jgi:hypothetical protein
MIRPILIIVGVVLLGTAALVGARKATFTSAHGQSLDREAAVTSSIIEKQEEYRIQLRQARERGMANPRVRDWAMDE